MTNGQVTKQILKAAKELDGAALVRKVSVLLMSFPLSSHKLVYDNDASKMTEDKWQLLMTACEETDKIKFDGQARWLQSMGMKPATSFGRYAV